MMDTAIGLSRKIHQFPFVYVILPFYEFAECSSNICPSIKRNISTIKKKYNLPLYSYPQLHSIISTFFDNSHGPNSYGKLLKRPFD